MEGQCDPNSEYGRLQKRIAEQQAHITTLQGDVARLKDQLHPSCITFLSPQDADKPRREFDQLTRTRAALGKALMLFVNLIKEVEHRRANNLGGSELLTPMRNFIQEYREYMPVLSSEVDRLSEPTGSMGVEEPWEGYKA